jgi:hypothetical protein
MYISEYWLIFIFCFILPAVIASCTKKSYSKYSEEVEDGYVHIPNEKYNNMSEEDFKKQFEMVVKRNGWKVRKKYF